MRTTTTPTMMMMMTETMTTTTMMPSVAQVVAHAKTIAKSEMERRQAQLHCSLGDAQVGGVPT